MDSRLVALMISTKVADSTSPLLFTSYTITRRTETLGSKLTPRILTQHRRHNASSTLALQHYDL